jgi:aromatic-L-amino-acid decarboxylase
LCIATDGTDALIQRANASGQALFTRTVLDGRSVLRISIGSRTTTREHVLAAWDLLRSTLDELHAQPQLQS